MFWYVTFAPVLAGRHPARWPGQRRVEPSQSAPGRVRCPPARPQPPLQGRSAEGVERAGPSSPGHLSSAERPTHIKPPKTSRFEEKFLFEVQPCIFISDHKETLIQSPSCQSVSTHGKFSPASTLSLTYCMRNHPSDSVANSSPTPPPVPLFPSVIPRIHSKAVLSVGVVLISQYITVMQVNGI